jgi:PTS system ascorbate-specific IIA component
MGSARPDALSTLMPAEAIRLRVEAQDWRAAVAAAGEALVSGGATTAAYTDEMIATVEQMGPYIVLAPGIALPHARPSPAVLRTGVALVTLVDPVFFGHPQNDPVTLVVAFAATDKVSHVRALSALAGLLSDERIRAALREARDPREISRIIVAYEAVQAAQPTARLPPAAAPAARRSQASRRTRPTAG